MPDFVPEPVNKIILDFKSLCLKKTDTFQSMDKLV